MKEHHCVSIVPLFNHLTEEEQNQVESLILHRHFRKGETVWQPGEDPLLIIVAEGSMKVYMLSGSGREQLLRLLTPRQLRRGQCPPRCQSPKHLHRHPGRNGRLPPPQNRLQRPPPENPQPGPETSGNERPAHGGHRKPDPLPHDGKSGNKTDLLPHRPFQ